MKSFTNGSKFNFQESEFGVRRCYCIWLGKYQNNIWNALVLHQKERTIWRLWIKCIYYICLLNYFFPLWINIYFSLFQQFFRQSIQIKSIQNRTFSLHLNITGIMCLSSRHNFSECNYLEWIPPYIRMLSSDWLIKGVFFTNPYFFPLFPHRRCICPWEFRIAWYLPNTTLVRKIPSLNRLWRHECNSELLGLLLPTNDKVKKNDRRQCQPLFWILQS